MSDACCPDCQAPLQTGSTSCLCGWNESSAVMKNAGRGKPIPDSTHVCSWHSAANRCPLPASGMADGRWVCVGHARSLNNHAVAMALFQKIDGLMQGRATAMHDAIIVMERDACYWEKVGGLDVLKMDSSRLAELRMRQPEWFGRCVRVVQSEVWNDLEKASRGKISWEEFKKRR